MRDLRADHRCKILTRSVLLWAGVATAVAACGGTERPEAATDLAPSQITASTAPEPNAPPACDVDDLALSSFPDASGSQGTAAVIRISNEGSAQCEVDVSESPLADPLMEPDVWLQPHDEAEILVEHVAENCSDPEDIADVELRINGHTRDVTVDLPATCGVALTAIYAVEGSG